jgi:hypothetical protein
VGRVDRVSELGGPKQLDGVSAVADFDIAAHAACEVAGCRDDGLITKPHPLTRAAAHAHRDQAGIRFAPHADVAAHRDAPGRRIDEVQDDLVQGTLVGHSTQFRGRPLYGQVGAVPGGVLYELRLDYAQKRADTQGVLSELITASGYGLRHLEIVTNAGRKRHAAWRVGIASVYYGEGCATSFCATFPLTGLRKQFGGALAYAQL